MLHNMQQGLHNMHTGLFFMHGIRACLAFDRACARPRVLHKGLVQGLRGLAAPGACIACARPRVLPSIRQPCARPSSPYAPGPVLGLHKGLHKGLHNMQQGLHNMHKGLFFMHGIGSCIAAPCWVYASHNGACIAFDSHGVLCPP